MKRLLIILTVICSFVSAAAADKGTPKITFSETVHDFGTIKEDGGPVSYKFRFTNDGDAPLVIMSARAACGCTRPEFPLKPVEPGKDAFIKVTYLPAGRPGEFIKEVKVKTNDKTAKTIKLKINGIVIPQSK